MSGIPGTVAASTSPRPYLLQSFGVVFFSQAVTSGNFPQINHPLRVVSGMLTCPAVSDSISSVFVDFGLEASVGHLENSFFSWGTVIIALTSRSPFYF